MTQNVIPFPIDVTRQLSFDQAVSIVKGIGPSFGLIAFYDTNDKIGIWNFGNITRKDALWIAEQLVRHSQGEEIS